jgi:peptidoglycan/LPS O-acetylase OafA/YrhL
MVEPAMADDEPLAAPQRARGWRYRFGSLQDVLAKHRGLGPGFDLIRIGLALAILYGHCFFIAGSSSMSGAPGGPGVPAPWAPRLFSGQYYFRLMLVPMFFALSGFLVTGSAFRTKSVRVFLVFRVLRILPALFTEVCLSAILLGPLLTVVPLSKYFSDPRLFAYFGNIVGRVRFELPGLFLNNPVVGIVNTNLWTLPPEFYCYLFIALMIVSGLLFHRTLFSIIFAIATVSLLTLDSLSFPMGGIATSLIYYFFVGCFFFHWREHIPFSLVAFALSVFAAYALFAFRLYYAGAFFVTYIIVFLGLVNFPKIRFIQSGDYSYGVYLYGFPIAQALVASMPVLRGHGWWVLLAATPITVAFAALSWHTIERPTLALKRYFNPTVHPVT